MEHSTSELTGSLNPPSVPNTSRTLDQMEQQQPEPTLQTEENKISRSQWKVLTVIALLICIVFAVMIGITVSNSNESSANQSDIESPNDEQLPSIDPPEDKPSLSPHYRTLIPIAPTISFPSNDPSHSPDVQLPSNNPSSNPQSATPSDNPSNNPQSAAPSDNPSSNPQSALPSDNPSHNPQSAAPSDNPSGIPQTGFPSDHPSQRPLTAFPSNNPSNNPQSATPSDNPSGNPTLQTDGPTSKTDNPTLQTTLPSNSNNPSNAPSGPCDGGFRFTTRSCRMEHSTVLACQALNAAGNQWKETSINLDEHLANNPQNPQLFEINSNGGFSKDAKNIHYDASTGILKADLLSGSTYVSKEIDLSHYIGNIATAHGDGELKWSACFQFQIDNPTSDAPSESCDDGGSSFRETTASCRMEHLTVLTCRAKNGLGQWGDTSINLDEHLAYNAQNPQLFELNRNGGFSKDAKNIQYDASTGIIKADLLSGSTYVTKEINLNKYLYNGNGELKWSPCLSFIP